MIDTVIFDWDGVILDSFPDQFEYFKKVCSVLDKNFPYNTLEEFRKEYAEPVYPVMYTKLGFDWDAERSKIWDIYNEHKAQSDPSVFYPVLRFMHSCYAVGLKVGISSSNLESLITKKMQQTLMPWAAKSIVGKESLPVYMDGEIGQPMLKPHPHSLLLSLGQLRSLASNSIYIGDQSSDIRAAKAVPMRVAAVTWGYGLKDELAKLKPDIMVDTVAQLAARIAEEVRPEQRNRILENAKPPY